MPPPARLSSRSMPWSVRARSDALVTLSAVRCFPAILLGHLSRCRQVYKIKVCGQGTITLALTTSMAGHFRFTTCLRSTGIESGQLWSFYWGAGHEGTSCMLIQLINLFSYITPIDYTHYRFNSFQTAFFSITTISISKHKFHTNYINFHCQLYQFPSPITSISIASVSILHQSLHCKNGPKP